MAREIKFRAWNAKTKEMLEVREAIFINGELSDYHAVGDHAISGWRGNDVIMQFTGLRDRNGVEIFEGDIIKLLRRDWPSKLDSYPELTNEQYLDMIADRVQVIFTQGEFCMEKDGSYGSKHYIGFNDGGYKDLFEVIGNIYENPGLLASPTEHSSDKTE